MQGSTVAVSDRATAQHVVKTFTEQRIGMVQCRIADEMQPRCGAVQVPPIFMHGTVVGHSKSSLAA